MPKTFKDHFKANDITLVNQSKEIRLTAYAYDSDLKSKIPLNYAIFNRLDEKISEGQLSTISELIILNTTIYDCSIKDQEKKIDEKSKEKCNKLDKYYCNPNYPDYEFCPEQLNGSCCEIKCSHNCGIDKYWVGDECLCKPDFRIVTWSEKYEMNSSFCDDNNECKTFNQKKGEFETYGVYGINLEPNIIYNSSFIVQSKDGYINNFLICIYWSREIHKVTMPYDQTKIPENYKLYDVCYSYPNELVKFKSNKVYYSVYTKNEEINDATIKLTLIDVCEQSNSGKRFNNITQIKGNDICIPDNTFEITVFPIR